jgi:hypothetical protein
MVLSAAESYYSTLFTKFLAIGRQVWPNREPNLPDGIA